MNESEMEDLLGERRGREGRTRTTYLVKSDPLVVIKKANKTTLHNLIEWFFWTQVVGTKWASTFGNCLPISPTGRYLMMEKLEDLSPAEADTTPLLPSLLRDVWPHQFGRNANGQIKCRDYANVRLEEALEADEGYIWEWQRLGRHPGP